MIEIKLKHIAIALDGGSKLFIDSNDNMYWQCYRVGQEYKDMQGKLYLGYTGNKPYKLAKGMFVLVEMDDETGIEQEIKLSQ